ncbi:MAG: preprotein translocase subunit SecG [Proteobacteria bacterium]|nr:preprotein translocase subunit SecG [Pseudomonadota bacterium]
MDTLVLTIHVIACIFLIVLVLLQSGQEGMGVIFGGGSSSMFGSSGAGGLLVKVTAGLATIFLITSLTYNILTKQAPTSVMDAVQTMEQAAPVTEETPPAPAPAE